MSRRKMIISGLILGLLLVAVGSIAFRQHEAPSASNSADTLTKPAPSVPAKAALAGVKIPLSGMYWGGVNKNDTTPYAGCTGSGFALLECKVASSGQQQNILPATARASSYGSSMEHFYTDCNTPIGDGIKGSTKVAGRQVLLVSMKCDNWTTLATGNAEQIKHIEARAVELAALNFPVILVFHHEPENDSCDGVGKYFGSPEDYRAAYRQFASAVRTASPNSQIALGWTLMGFTFNQNGTQLWNQTTGCQGQTTTGKMIRNPNNWYPGDDVVDWLLPDIYDNEGHFDFNRLMTAFMAWRSSCAPPNQHPTTNYNCTTTGPAARANKPYGLAETSVQGDVGHRVEFFKDMAVQLNTPRYDGMKAYAFWSSYNPKSGFDGRIDRDPNHLVLDQYAQLELSERVHKLTFAPAAGN